MAADGRWRALSTAADSGAKLIVADGGCQVREDFKNRGLFFIWLTNQVSTTLRLNWTGTFYYTDLQAGSHADPMSCESVLAACSHGAIFV